MQPPIVYVIDDDPEVLRATERLLPSAGMAVCAFQSPRAFLASYDEQRGSGCVVLDLAMPELTGAEVQRELAERGELLPIVFLTGRGDHPDLRGGDEERSGGLSRQPVDDADLLAAVDRALANAAVLRQERAARARIESALASCSPPASARS